MEAISIRTGARTELLDVTKDVQDVVGRSGVNDGVCTLFVPHTTAAVTINENADPSVRRDILSELNKIVPFEDNYSHTEGNSAAHIKSSVIGPSEQVLVKVRRLVLGTWQGIYFCEFDGPRSRQLYVDVR